MFSWYLLSASSGPTHPSAGPFGHPVHHPGNFLTPASHLGKTTQFSSSVSFWKMEIEMLIVWVVSPTRTFPQTTVLWRTGNSQFICLWRTGKSSTKWVWASWTIVVNHTFYCSVNVIENSRLIELHTQTHQNEMWWYAFNLCPCFSTCWIPNSGQLTIRP